MSQNDINIKVEELTPVNVRVTETPINITIDGYNFDNTSFANLFVIEVPTLVSGYDKRYETTYNFYYNTLKVYINGLKERYSTVTQISDNIFELDIAIDNLIDYIEVEYILKV